MEASPNVEARIVTLVPTRGRPDNALRLLSAFAETAYVSQLVFCIDDDEIELYMPLIEATEECGLWAKVVNASRMGLNGTLNHWATWYAEDCEYIAFMGDDHLPKTQHWDLDLAKAIGNKLGVAYGDDLIQGENLPTAVMLSAAIVKKLEFMSPPELKHLFMDNFWKHVGSELGNLNYLPSVVIEHLHYTVGKAELDERYQAVNNAEMHLHDEQVFANYVQNQWPEDLAKLVGSND